MSLLSDAAAWRTPEELAAICSLGLPGALRPHQEQSVRCVRQVIRRWATCAGEPSAVPEDRGLIVLAIDSLSYRTAREVMTADELVCPKSTFPSTSAVAWVSSVTGGLPHGYSVLLYADHGQVPNRCNASDVARFDAIAGAHWCWLPPGGGSVRWLYPRPGREQSVLARMNETFGDVAIVCPAYIYENGSFTEDEMLVPLAAWGPR